MCVICRVKGKYKSPEEPDANIKAEYQMHSEFKELYTRALQDKMLSEECKKGLEDVRNLHKWLKTNK